MNYAIYIIWKKVKFRLLFLNSIFECFLSSNLLPVNLVPFSPCYPWAYKMMFVILSKTDLCVQELKYVMRRQKFCYREKQELYHFAGQRMQQQATWRKGLRRFIGKSRISLVSMGVVGTCSRPHTSRFREGSWFLKQRLKGEVERFVEESKKVT